MPKVRKKKTPIPLRADSGSSSNPNSSRALIRRFHILLRKQTQLKNQGGRPADAEALADAEREMKELGGLSAYQRMSSIGQGKDRGGGSEKVLIAWLMAMGMSQRKALPRLRLLEVGALKPDNYQSCASWIEVMPIDLHSRHPSILEQDFLLMNETEHSGKWDVVSLSLVLNFVPDTKDRGRMLRLAHTMLRADGLLFLALPLSCVINSRYLTCDHHKALMSAVGFVQTNERWKRDGKMAYWLYRKGEPDGEHAKSFQKKTVLLEGNRNNFSILL